MDELWLVHDMPSNIDGDINMIITFYPASVCNRSIKNFQRFEKILKNHRKQCVVCLSLKCIFKFILTNNILIYSQIKVWLACYS